MESKHWQDTIVQETPQNNQVYQITGGVLLVVIGIGIGSVIFAEDSGYATNLFTEFISIAITVFVLDILNAVRAKQQRRKQLKNYVASKHNIVALQALDELKAEGWLDLLQEDDIKLDGANWNKAHLSEIQLSGTFMPDIKLESANFSNTNLSDSSLKGANLSDARLYITNLSDTDLYATNLNRAKLIESNFENSDLTMAVFVDVEAWWVNFKNADLTEADFTGSSLRQANFVGACLFDTSFEVTVLRESSFIGVDLAGVNFDSAFIIDSDFTGVRLSGTKLSNANLSKTKLMHANMHGVICDEDTVLPDGRKWTADVDWTQYGAVVIEDYDEWLIYLYKVVISENEQLNKEHWLEDFLIDQELIQEPLSKRYQ